jgi:hypothetical protein
MVSTLPTPKIKKYSYKSSKDRGRNMIPAKAPLYKVDPKIIIGLRAHPRSVILTHRMKETIAPTKNKLPSIPTP